MLNQLNAQPFAYFAEQFSSSLGPGSSEKARSLGGRSTEEIGHLSLDTQHGLIDVDLPSMMATSTFSFQKMLKARMVRNLK